MALTATLAIDIRNFEHGLEKAEVKLQGFDRAQKNLNRDLKRLLEDFSGQKVVIEAARMAEAVERVGGAARLTEAEQRRVNATVTEAIAKYHALGQEAPADLLKIQKETEGANEKTSLLTRGVQALIAAFSVRAIARAAGDVLEFTGRLSDLAVKSGISTESLQRLAYVTEQAGVPLDRIADGAVMLSRNLVGGNDSAVKAVEALGLNLSQLIAQGPERAFLAIGEAIAKVPNPMERAALATAAFGRSGAEFLPAFTSDMSKLADQAQASGAILSDDLVQAGDRAGDAITRMKAAGMAVLAQFFVPILPAVEAVANWLGTALPQALGTARSGIDTLLRKGLELKVWLLDLAVSIAQTVRDVPVLGRVFGESSGDIDRMRQAAQAARDHLNAFNAQGLQPVKRETQAAIAPVTGFGEAMAGAGRKAKQAGEDTKHVGIIWGELGNIVRFQIAGVLSESLTEFKTDTDNVTEAMQDLYDAIARVEGKAIEIKPVLESTFKLPWVEAKKTVEEVEPAVDGFFTRIFGSASDLGTGVSSIFQAAFVGGGGALGAVKAFATEAMSNLLAMIPGIGGFVSAFAGPIIEMFSRLIGRARDFFRELFGGPSRGERNDRGSVAAFVDEIAAGSAAAAGETEEWRRANLALEEAYLAVGRSAEEAHRDAERLLASSREGGEETWRVIDEIRRKMQEQAAAAVDGVDAIAQAINKLPKDVEIEIRGRYVEPDMPTSDGYISGTMGRHGSWFRNFGQRTHTNLHGVEAVVTPQQAPVFARDVLSSVVNPAPRAGQASSVIQVPVYLDGRQIAMATVPHIPSALRQSGAGSATWP